MKHGTTEYYKAEYFKALEATDKANGKLITQGRLYKQLKKDYKAQGRLFKTANKRVYQLERCLENTKQGLDSLSNSNFLQIAKKW